MISFGCPIIGPRERELVNQVLASGRLTESKMCERFASLLEERTSKHVTLTSSGTSALHAALLAVGVGPGDEVITSATTYAASMNAIMMCGAVPVIVDVDPAHWTLLAPTKHITPRTKAILPVALFGSDCHMVAVDAAHRHFVATGQRVYVIYDRAEDTIGTSLADVDVFSFYASKVICTGEGGAIACKDIAHHDRAWSLCHQASAGQGTYRHVGLGYNYRLTELQAAIGVAQMERLDEFVAKRKEIFAAYDAFLPPWCIRQSPEHQSGFWAFAIQIPQPRLYAAVKVALKAADIEFRPVFPPVCDAPHFSGIQHGRSTAADLARWGLVLPTHCGLTEQAVEFICDTIRGAE
jgi:perosamine synthetase